MSPIIERIKNEITYQGIQQKELADMIGVTDVTMCRWMTGLRSPSLKYVEKMLSVLGMHIAIYKEYKIFR